MVLKITNLNIFDVHWKIWLFRWGVHEKPIQMRDCLKRGLGQFSNLRRGLARKKEKVVFLRGVNTLIHTMSPTLSKSLACPLPHCFDLKCRFCNLHAVFGHFAQIVSHYSTPFGKPWSNTLAWIEYRGINSLTILSLE